MTRCEVKVSGRRCESKATCRVGAVHCCEECVAALIDAGKVRRGDVVELALAVNTGDSKNPPMFAIGSPEWPGLSKLAEESGEALQVIGKLLGSGGNVNHWDGTNLRDRLIEETGDVLAAAEFVAKANGFYERAQERARLKLRMFWKWHGSDREEAEER